MEERLAWVPQLVREQSGSRTVQEGEAVAAARPTAVPLQRRGPRPRRSAMGRPRLQREHPHCSTGEAAPRIGLAILQMSLPRP